MIISRTPFRVSFFGGGTDFPEFYLAGRYVLEMGVRQPDSILAYYWPSLDVAWAGLAWMPWVLLSVLVFLWGLPPIKSWLNHLSLIEVKVPWLHQAIYRAPPVVTVLKAEEAIFSLNWLSATGTERRAAGRRSFLRMPSHWKVRRESWRDSVEEDRGERRFVGSLARDTKKIFGIPIRLHLLTGPARPVGS